MTFLEGSPDINDAETLKERLQGLFADESAAVWLSSIHKAKGLESDRVFILRPDRIELKHKNMRGWQIEQERNLHYVALTRAKSHALFRGRPARRWRLRERAGQGGKGPRDGGRSSHGRPCGQPLQPVGHFQPLSTVPHWKPFPVTYPRGAVQPTAPRLPLFTGANQCHLHLSPSQSHALCWRCPTGPLPSR